MNSVIVGARTGQPRKSLHLIATSLAFVLLVQPGLVVVNAQSRSQRGAKKVTEISGDQRIAHVLSRLTFGARPGDFDRVKAIGVEAFINQQLDPDSIPDDAVPAKLGKLPTLAMATPVIFEQYTPPKPAAVPSPAPAKVADPGAPPQKSIAQNAPSQTPQISPNSGSAAMQNEMPMAAK